MPFKVKKPVSVLVDDTVMKSPNICDLLTPEDLTAIGSLVIEGYKADEFSRSVWKRRMQSGMDLALQVQKTKTFPWPNCSNVTFPLVTIGALQFSSRAYGHIFSTSDVANYRVVGEDPQGLLEARAVRLSTHMSWQRMEQDEPWEEQHDRGLLQQAIVGCRFMKSYFNGEKAYGVSENVSAFDLVMDYFATSVDECGRKTQRLPPMYRNEVYSHVKRKVFRDILEEGWYIAGPSAAGANNPNATDDARADHRIGQTPTPAPDDSERPFQFLEQHRFLDLDDDGYAEPYIVTVEETSGCAVRVVARWDTIAQIERDSDGGLICIRPTEYYTKYGFIPSPDGGIYDIGFGILLGPLNEAVNSGINQLIDSGTMQNSLGGFLGRGAKIRGGVYTMAPWEWKRVDSTGDDLRKNLVPTPDRQPSAVMFNLIGLLIEYSNRVASTTEQMVGKSPGQNTPAETSRNTLEQGMQVFTTIFKRTWRSMKQEFKKLYKINAVYMPATQRFGEGNSLVKKEDYQASPDLIVPSADPSVISFQMRFFQAQSIRQASQQVPGYDIDYVERQFLKSMRVQGINKYFPGPEKVKPPPNPKMVVAQMQMQAKAQDLEFKKQSFIVQLMEERRLNTAKILGLQSKAASDLAGIQGDQAALQLEHLNLALETLVQHNEMISRRIEALSTVNTETEGGEGGESGDQFGGTGSVENAPGDEAGIPADEALES